MIYFKNLSTTARNSQTFKSISLSLVLATTFISASAFSQTDSEKVHLKASYAKSMSAKRGVTTIYKEVVVHANPKGTYTAIGFKGGYIGLAGHYGDAAGHINFSIWDQDGNKAVLRESSKIGNPDNHRFGHEGSGFHAELDFPWQRGVRYKTMVKIEHVDGGTLWSAFFGEAKKEKWYLCGRIFVPRVEIPSLGRPGGFLEHVGKKNADSLRHAGFGPGWVKTAAGWEANKVLRYSFKDKNASDGYVSDESTLDIMIKRNMKNRWSGKKLFTLQPGRDNPPVDPDNN